MRRVEQAALALDTQAGRAGQLFHRAGRERLEGADVGVGREHVLDAARAARDEAASIAARIGASPDSELGRALAALNDALAR